MLHAILAIVILLLGASHSTAVVPGCSLKSDAVERFVSQKAKELKGEEYCQYRMYSTLSDVDLDEIDDFIMVFTIEGIGGGGNNSAQYLAVWTSRMKAGDEPLSLKVGERGERIIDSLDVENQKIILHAHEYQKSDAMCCPSNPVQHTFSVSNGKIVEVK